MSIMMPASDQAVLARRDDIVAALRAIVPGEGVIDSAAEMLPGDLETASLFGKRVAEIATKFRG